jgi:hypothetical protein
MAVRDGDITFFGEGGGAAPGLALAPTAAKAGGVEGRLARLESEVSFLRGQLGSRAGAGFSGGDSASGRGRVGRRVGHVESIQRFGYRLGRTVNALGGLTVTSKAAGQTALAKAVAGRAGGSAIGGIARAAVLKKTLGTVKSVLRGGPTGLLGKALGSTAGQGVGSGLLTAAALGSAGNAIGAIRKQGIVKAAQGAGETFFGGIGDVLMYGGQGIASAFGYDPTEEEAEADRAMMTEKLTLGIGANYRFNKRVAEARAKRDEIKAQALAEATLRLDALSNAALGDAFKSTFDYAVRTGDPRQAGQVSIMMASAVNRAYNGALAEASRDAEARAFKEVPPVR